jgi:dCMP deaminase
MNWQEYYMSMAFLVAMKSKDKSTKVGAVVVGPGGEIRSTGYNGFCRGVLDKEERFQRPLKYKFTEHAERNACYNAVRMGVSLLDCTMYTHSIPCSDCARAIIQSGISVLVTYKPYDEDNSDGFAERWNEDCEIAMEMLMEAGVKWIQYDGPVVTNITVTKDARLFDAKRDPDPS